MSHVQVTEKDEIITAEKFKERVGSEPENDDLERCNCKQAGELGHYMCGWCKECDLPRFICGHTYIITAP